MSWIGKESFCRVADPSFLLDSNILIYILRDAASHAALRLGEATRGSVVTSAICHAEVMHGVSFDPVARAMADQLFGLVPPLPFDAAAGEQYATLPFKRARFDRLIAAHALALRLTLVTNNGADFADIPGLKVENWTLPL